ncbi:MAG: glycoside hydrolase family 25 protein [Lachnospiraceae bacterium]|nr:glycoside hydrolase family 25 protein [Lachnospiraceae bacterium]
MNRKKKEITFYIMTILACLAAMTVVVVAALLIYDKIRQKDEAVEANAEIDVVMYSEEEVNLMLAEAVAQAEQSAREETSDSILNQILESLEGGTSTVATLRPFYPNHIVVVSNGRFHFVPIRDDLKQHSLLQENLQVLETGELQYVENGEVISHKGIDVSRYQGNIDWNKVAAQGVEYVIIRVGIRGWGQEGTLVLDEKFEDNIKGASAAGLKVGVYFFSQAITDEEALEEADLVLDAIAGYDVSYPIVYDVEKTSEASGRMNQLSVEDRTRMAHIFLDRIKEAGYTPMIYANMEMWSVLINMAEFEDVDKWFAYYDTDLYFPYEYAIWQYSDTGRIDGIGGDVDLNISFKEW